MRPIHFPEETVELERPPSMTEEECAPLPVHRNEEDAEFISCWRATWRERLRILLWGRMWLVVLGDRHPPVALHTESPWP